MKNKINFRKCLTTSIFVSILLFICFIALNIYEYHEYSYNFNKKIASIINIIEEKYPEVTEDELLEIIKSNKLSDKILNRYGIDIYKKSILKVNENTYHRFLKVNIVFIIGSFAIIIIIFFLYNLKKEHDIKEITKIIEAINNKNYDLRINTLTEDELSILKNDIYKTTIMLKEAADNSNVERINLKKSLEDISHQLKTPLTSVLILLDNLIDNPEMDNETRDEFIRDIKKEINAINFLVQSILKLSKFESNTITLINKEVLLDDLVKDSIDAVSIISDLKNVKINLTGKTKGLIKVDNTWQKEAISNIIKNAIEHSKEESDVDITLEENNVYVSVKITNYGEVIDSNDLKHIFERFYKCSNSNADSIGIGLPLAKTIIENNNGTIIVNSKDNKTTFEIKYFKI